MDNDSIIPVINNKVGAILSLLSKQQNSSGVVAEVDFIVDMFDRDDADSLGEYWEEKNGFAIRNGVCVCNSDVSANQVQVIFASSGANAENETAIASESQRYFYYLQGQALVTDSSFYNKSNRHMAKLRSRNVKVKITFDINNESGRTTNVENGVLREYETIYPNIAGCALYGKDEVTKVALSMMAAKMPVVTTPSAFISAFRDHASGGRYALSASAQAANLTNGSIIHSLSVSSGGSPSPNVKFFTETIINRLIRNIGGDALAVGNRTFSVSASSGADKVPSMEDGVTNNFYVGENSITLSYDENNDIKVFFNDILHATINSSYITERSFAGLALVENNGLGIIQQYGYTVGIKSFKAWADGDPEPPNETGFGTYNANENDALKLKYSDKYHEPITEKYLNENGRERTRVVGYQYNPLA